MSKRIIGLLLALVMCLSLTAAWASGEPSADAEQATLLPDGETGPALDGGDTVFTINGVEITRTSSSILDNCWYYAQEIYNLIWDEDFPTNPSSSDNMLRNITSSEDRRLTTEHVKSYISAAELGAVIRLSGSNGLDHRYDDTPGHSQILVQKDSRGFTVIESAVNNDNSREKYYTWSGYVDWWADMGYHEFFKYIAWPGAPAYVAPPVEDMDEDGQIDERDAAMYLSLGDRHYPAALALQYAVELKSVGDK